MGQIPHVYLPGPWEGPVVRLTGPTHHHLERVLRRGRGDALTYTDGEGRVGSGSLISGGLRRGDEQRHPRPTPGIVVAAAPPRSKRRARVLVEKVAELGADRLVWLSTRHGEGRPPVPDRAHSWAVSALEQSRGHHLLATEGPVSPDHSWPPGYDVYVADRAADGAAPTLRADAAAVVVLIGPEAGFAPDEVPEPAMPLRLAANVLRVETAAIAATALLALERHRAGR